MSTFIAECPPETWTGLGFDAMPTEDAPQILYARQSPLTLAFPPAVMYLLRRAVERFTLLEQVRQRMATVVKVFYHRAGWHEPVVPGRTILAGTGAAMRIACVGAGPAGLYFSILVKLCSGRGLRVRVAPIVKAALR